LRRGVCRWRIYRQEECKLKAFFAAILVLFLLQKLLTSVSRVAGSGTALGCAALFAGGGFAIGFAEAPPFAARDLASGAAPAPAACCLPAAAAAAAMPPAAPFADGPLLAADTATLALPARTRSSASS